MSRARRTLLELSGFLVALTGYGQDSDKQRVKQAGFDYHLVKPVSLEILQDLLASLPARQDAVEAS